MKWTTWKERINLLWTKIFNWMPQFITFSEDCENSEALKYWWIVHREWTQKYWIYFLMAEYFFSFVVYLSPLTMAWSWGVFNFNSWINGKYTRQEKKKHEHDELRTLGKIFLRGPTTLLSEQRQTYICNTQIHITSEDTRQNIYMSKNVAYVNVKWICRCHNKQQWL